ncbi:MAG: hypothetical protein U0S49_09745, partial [Rhodospirillales bacterium]|nr:hypothetical protein [Rhodospirillales bacterium]
LLRVRARNAGGRAAQPQASQPEGSKTVRRLADPAHAVTPMLGLGAQVYLDVQAASTSKYAWHCCAQRPVCLDGHVWPSAWLCLGARLFPRLLGA